MSSFLITRRNGDTFEVLVDDADLGAVLAAGPWRAGPQGHTTYVLRTVVKADGKKGTESLHRFLLSPTPGLHVDHANCDGLDNRRDNLRAAERWQNAGNQRIHKDGTSGFKGVTWNKRVGKWQAQLQRKGQKGYLGLYETAEAAHDAYVLAAETSFGVFRRNK